MLYGEERVDSMLERGNPASAQLRKLKIVACIMSFILSLEVIVKPLFEALVATGGIEPPTLGL